MRIQSAWFFRFFFFFFIFFVKLGYIFWFYRYGLELNIGDTSAYIDSESKDVYMARAGDGFSFAYWATVLFSSSSVRMAVELSFAFIFSFLVFKINNLMAVFVYCLYLILPSNLAFITVASKEMIVFPLLLLILAWGFRGLAAIPLVFVIKPTFALIYLVHAFKKINDRSLFVFFLSFCIVLVVGYVYVSELYSNFYYRYSVHFEGGGLNYSDPGVFPFSIFMRVFGLYSEGFTLPSVVISLSMMVSNALLLWVLVKSSGWVKGACFFMIYIASVAAYSVHNLGSASRYQVPVSMAMFVHFMIAVFGSKKNYDDRKLRL